MMKKKIGQIATAIDDEYVVYSGKTYEVKTSNVAPIEVSQLECKRLATLVMLQRLSNSLLRL